MSVNSLAGQTPHTKEKAKTKFIGQLLDLHPRQHLQVHLEDGPIPDFHSEETVYEVTKTEVATTKNGEESFFNVYLGSTQVRSTSSPVFKLTVSRPVPDNVGQTRPSAKWASYWLNARTGTNQYGNIRWNQLCNDPVDITVVDDIERCSECDRPL